MLDRTSKFLMAMIALGLWAHTAALVFQPGAAGAQDATGFLRRIDQTLTSIALGVCVNSKLC